MLLRGRAHRPLLPALLLAGACLLLPACGPRFAGPLRLLASPTADGKLPRTGALATGGETRPALLESARFELPLPRRPLLTFGAGLAWAGEGEAPGWYRLTVRAGGRTVDERTINPRATRGWKDVVVPLDGLGRRTTIEFSLRFTDRDARDIPRPSTMLLGVSEPVVHDLDDFGKEKGVLLVSIDTLRRDHVGAHGYPRPTTPRLDALAAEGVLCEDAVSTSSWTLPAHASLMTSTDPGVHGATDMGHGFNRRVPTLPGVLRNLGHATQAVTSHLYVSGTYGLDDGFDHLDFLQDRKADDVADRAVSLLDRFGDRPFFVFLHLYDPHWHYDPPEAYKRMFARPYSGTVTGLWQDFSRRDQKTLTAADVDHLRDLYDGEIRYADDALGRVLDHLALRGLDRSTLVVVTSDHGEEFLEHGGWEHQRTLYEEVIRVPLAFRGPGVAPRRERAQVSLLDVAPTILAFASLPVPPTMTGRSLLSPVPEREAYGETDHTTDRTRKLFLRAGASRWKLVASLGRSGEPLGEEWYDLGPDPREKSDVRPPGEVAEGMRSRALARWKAGRTVEGPDVSLSPEQRERLRALGYVGP